MARGDRGEQHRAATIVDVAARAGVSAKTVSRALNDEGGVSSATAARVRAAAAELGYRRNVAASSLRRGGVRGCSVGVVVPDVADPVFAAFTRGVEVVARRRDCVLLVASTSGRSDEAVASLVASGIDGLVVVGPVDARVPARSPPLVIVTVDAPLGDPRAAMAAGTGAAERLFRMQSHRAKERT